MYNNPYAAPVAPPPPQPGAEGVFAGTPQPWEVGEVVTSAWNHFKRCWPVLVGGMVIMSMISAVPGMIHGLLVATRVVEQGTVAAAVLQMVATLLQYLISAFFQVGWLRMLLTVLRNGNPELGTLFSGGNRFLALFASFLLTFVGAAFGFLLLIVPGVFLLLALSFTSFFVVDANMGPLAAMRASFTATKGQRLNILVFGFVAMLLMVAGVIACCVGIFVASPVVALAMGLIYLRATGRDVRMAPPQGYPPAPPGFGPPPGYGAPPGYGPPPYGGGPGPYGGPQGGGYGGGYPPY
jgi:hypothetical protein